MKNEIIQQQIQQKESEIVTKIEELKKHKELGPLIMEGSCTGTKCNVFWTRDLAKLQLHEIMNYFANLHDLVLEKLREETKSELGRFLVLFYDKKELQNGKNVA